MVTNKPARFTDPLMAALGLTERAASIISGDTCAHPKPHPEPLLCASREIGLPPRKQCLYVGDAERDMEAAIAAGMRPIIAVTATRRRTTTRNNGAPTASSNIPQELLRFL